MANISHIIKGQSDWQEPINQLIDLTNGGVGKPLSVGTVNDAITFTSGFHQITDGGHPYLKYVKFDDGQVLAELFITGWGTWNKGNNDLGFIPDNFVAPQVHQAPLALHWDSSDTTYVQLIGNKLTLIANYDNTGDTTAQIGATSILYFTNSSN